MSKTILLVPDQHAHPNHDNSRADILAKLTIDLQPDIVVNGGDAADMSSLATYDRGKRSFVTKTYKADMEAHWDFQSRWWDPVKSRKKKTPYRVVLEGNHEHRVERALDLSTELSGTIGFDKYGFDEYYHEVVRYDGDYPGVVKIEGILFAHYFVSGIKGLPVSGERPATVLLAKNGCSCVAFHTHTLDFATRKTVDGRVLNGLVAGCYQDYVNDWAGPIGNLWRPGVSILHNVEDGNYDYQFVSLESLKEYYGYQTGSSVATKEPRSEGPSYLEVSATED